MQILRINRKWKNRCFDSLNIYEYEISNRDEMGDEKRKKKFLQR